MTWIVALFSDILLRETGLLQTTSTEADCETITSMLADSD